MISHAESSILHRVSFDLLDASRRTVRALDGVRSATRERNIYATPRSGATLEVSPQAGIDWRTARVRWWATAEYHGEATEPIPLFTGIPVVDGEKRTAAGAPLSMKLLDFSAALDVALGSHHAVEAGQSIIGLVRAMLATVGARDAVVTDSPATVSAAMFWAATETKRRYVNDLLRAAGYAAVWADELGRLRCEPYVDPADRPVVPDLGFVHGRTCTYQPEFTVNNNTSNIPNVATVTARTPEPYPPVVGTARLPAEHPYSVESRKGWIVPYTESEVDLAVTPPLPDDPAPADVTAYLARLQVAADAYAARCLQERAAPSTTYTVENRWRPFDLQTATAFVAPARGVAPAIRTTVTIVKDSLDYEAGGILTMTTTLQEVPR